jgi:hypothetical protein
MARATHLTIPKIASLLGITPAHAWRRAHAGDFGPLVKSTGGWWTVEIAEVERRKGVIFSADQIQRTQKNKRIEQADLFTRAQLDAAIDNAVYQRDEEWRCWRLDRTERALNPRGPYYEKAQQPFAGYQTSNERTIK